MTTITWLPDAAWRGALLLGLAFVIARLLRSQPAAVRHVLWTGALAGVMAMPVLSVLAPVRLPVALPQRVLDIAPTPSGASAFNLKSGIDAKGESHDLTVSPSADNSAGTALSASAVSPAPRLLAWLRDLTLAGWLALIWIAGAAVMSSRLLIGFVALRRLSSRAHETEDVAILELADACAARLGLHDVPRLIFTPGVTMPCTAGWVRPVILMPDESAGWAHERLEIVLLHEMSHIRRMDIVPHLLSEFTRVVHWFNPLVWLAAARLRAEAERATDDRVVQAGAKPSEYAGHLLDIVTQARPAWHPAPLMPLARRSEFEGRMLAILESGGRALPRARWALGTAALIGGLSLGVASMEGASASATPGPDSEIEDAGVVPDDVREQDAPDNVTPRRPEVQNTVRESAVAALADALRDPVASVRQAAAQALGATKDSVAVRALMEVLRTDESAMVRRSAAWSLGEIGDELAIPALTEALTRDRDVEVRKNAASALGSIDSPRATSALVQALERDTDVTVRIHAAEALSNIEDPASMDALIRVLNRDDDPGVRRSAIDAIDNLEGARAVPAVSRALRDANVEVRRAAAEALGAMEDRDAVPALMAVARDADAEMRRAVIQSLGSLGDRRALASFVAALADTDVEVRRAAAESFGNLDNVRTAPPELIRAMEDKDAEVRHSVAHALGHIKDPDAVRALIAHIGDSNVEVRQAVVESLDEFDDPGVVPALRTALKDTDPDVRKRAAEALGNRSRSK